MKIVKTLTKRNIKLFFKDKGLFFTSLITPLILLVLYATFLGNVFRNSFVDSLPEGVKMADDLVDGLVAGQLLSSILAVSCVTVAFCSNMLMVQDKANGTIKDLTISPVRKTDLALSYYLGTLASTLIVCFVALGASLIYVAFTGWYITFIDIMFLVADVLLLVMFGTALSSIIGFFLSSQGQISAVGSIVSSVYGFICGAYMPISSFASGLQMIIVFLPGTYGTSLLRNLSMSGVFAKMEEQDYPKELIQSFKDVVDCNVYFFDNKVPVWVMYIILGGTVAALVTIYVLMNVVKKKSKK